MLVMLTVGLVGGYVARSWLRQPSVLGEIGAGILLGPAILGVAGSRRICMVISRQCVERCGLQRADRFEHAVLYYSRGGSKSKSRNCAGLSRLPSRPACWVPCYRSSCGWERLTRCPKSGMCRRKPIGSYLRCSWRPRYRSTRCLSFLLSGPKMYRVLRIGPGDTAMDRKRLANE